MERGEGEEVWTTDKEAKGRAERKQRYMDSVNGGWVGGNNRCET